MSNVNGIEQHAQLSTSARAIANDCKKEIGFEKQLVLACLDAGLGTVGKKNELIQ